MNKTKRCYPVISFVILLTLIPIMDALQAQTQVHSHSEPFDRLSLSSEEQVSDLRQQFIEVTNDTLRMSISRELAWYYIVIDRDSSRYFLETQLELARALNQPMWEAHALTLLSHAGFGWGNYTVSLRLTSEALTLLEDEGIERGVWKPERLSRGVPPESARLSQLAMAWWARAHVHGRFGDRDEQQALYRRSISIAEQAEAHGVASLSYSGLGYTYIDSQPDSALFYLNIALEKGRDTAVRTSGRILYSIGIIHMNKGDYETASQYYGEAIRVNLDVNNAVSLGDSWYYMAELHTRTGDTGSAIESAHKSLELAESADYPGLLRRASSLLSSLYKDQNNFEQAYLYMEKALAVTEALQEEEQIRQANNLLFSEQLILRDLEEAQARSQARIRMIILLGVLFTIVVVAFLLYRNYRQQQGANTVLQKTLDDLKKTQDQLVQQEKLASLGQLTAGIAHEIKNPLNFVNNFSEVSRELIEEMKEERAKSQEARDEALVDEIVEDIQSNLKKIHEHGSRANGIVQSMLMHSRGGSGKMEPMDLNALVKEYLNLSFHGMRAGKEPINVDIDLQLDETIKHVPLIAEDFSRVILNLTNNAFDAMSDKMTGDEGRGTGNPNDQASHSNGYHPKLTVRTRSENGSVFIEIEDNGPGIPDEIKDKILQPFFTTKKGTQGTGLGLSITNDIIKAHGGQLEIRSQPGQSIFQIHLSL